MTDKIQIPEPPIDPEAPVLEVSIAVAELSDEGEGTLGELERETEEAEPGPGEELDEESRERGAGLRVKRDVSPELVEALRELGYVE